MWYRAAVTLTRRASILAWALALGCALSTGAAGQNGTGIDAQENVFGATNIHAVTGHGRIALGVSQDGDLTVLSGPSPSVNDQLTYLSSNDLEARSMPRFGAPEGLGSACRPVCRLAARRACPADAWEMNHYADGTAAGTFRFEIDTTAFAVWTAVTHAGWVEDPESYLSVLLLWWGHARTRKQKQFR